MTTPDTVDLIRRLRAYVESEDYTSAEPLCAEAAAELERLRTEADTCGAGAGCQYKNALIESQAAELERLRAQVAPAGCVLVPLEPTQEMLAADVETDAFIGIDDARKLWAAMLAAAPAQQAGRETFALQALIAAGHVTQEKVDEALSIAGNVLPAQSPTVGERSGWYFSEQQPTGTMLAIDPSGERHVVKAGRMDSVDGRRLLNAMARALCTAPPNQPAAQAEPAAWQERQEVSKGKFGEWYDRPTGWSLTRPREIDSGGIRYQFRPLYAEPPQAEPVMLNGLTEAETNATASVFGLTSKPAAQGVELTDALESLGRLVAYAIGSQGASAAAVKVWEADVSAALAQTQTTKEQL